MSPSGEIAVLVAQRAREGVDPAQAWYDVAAHIYSDSPTSRAKSCPRCTFLGLAEVGLIVGIPAGKYTRSIDNKRYAVAGVRLLLSNPELSECPDELWRRVMAGELKKHNAQMEVVAALWNAGDIVGAMK